MFKKMLAGLGVGSATVNLEIPNPRAELGGTLSGTLRIAGGSIDQQVEQIYITLLLTSRYKHGDETKSLRKEIGTIKIADGMFLSARQPQEELPVTVELPWGIPISRGSTRFFLETGLDIKSAVDPKDIDEIIVTPHKYLQYFFDAIHSLGFRDKHHSGDYNGRHQIFEYHPTTFMARQLDEIEAYVVALEDHLRIILQIDKKSRGILGGLMDDMDLDERHVGFTLSHSDMQDARQVAHMLQKLIEDEYRKI